LWCKVVGDNSERHLSKRMKIRDHAISFRVYPEKDRHYFYIAYVFRDKATMYRHFEVSNIETEWKKGVNKTNGNFDAVTQSWHGWDYSGKRGRPRLSRNLGQILFYVDGVGAGVVSHEMSHATLHFFERKRVSSAKLYDHKLQERFCWIQGHLVAQFWRCFFVVQPKIRWLQTNNAR
jgi:hypothetical protein